MGRPTTWVEWTDFFSKVILGLAAFSVTATTAFVTYSFSERKDAREQEERDRAAFEDLLTLVPPDQQGTLKAKRASLYCSGTASTQPRSVAVSDLCTWVASLGKQVLARGEEVRIADIKSTASKGVTAVLNSTAVSSQNIGVAAAEAAQPADESALWFAVVGTVPETTDPNAVRSLVGQLNQRLIAAGLPANDAHVYRTKISKSFALTSGQGKTAQAARARVSMLQKAGFADAFAQRDREWRLADELR